MKFENSVIIGPPVQQVFKFVTNPKNNAKWQTGELELEMTSENHFGVGATYRCVNRFMGKHIESEGIVTDYSSDKSCRIRIRTDSFTGKCRISKSPKTVNLVLSFTASTNMRYLPVKESVLIRIRHDLSKQ